MQSFVVDRLWFTMAPLSYLNESDEAQTIHCTMVMDEDEVHGKTAELEQYSVYEAVNAFDTQVSVENKFEVAISTSTIQNETFAEGNQTVKKIKKICLIASKIL